MLEVRPRERNGLHILFTDVCPAGRMILLLLREINLGGAFSCGKSARFARRKQHLKVVEFAAS
jgi:hypothetical protein